MDFGLAHIRESDQRLTYDGAVLGTPAYMAPEQAAGKLDQVGPASDQYSLGVIFYELLAGKQPFNGAATVVISQVISQEPAPPTTINSTVPRELEAICLQAMNKEANQRFTRCQEFANAMGRWLAHESVAVNESFADLQFSRRKAKTTAGQVSSAMVRRKWSLLQLVAAWSVCGIIAGSLLGVMVLLNTPKGQIQIEMQNANAMIEIDGRFYTPDELSKPISLPLGEHVLVRESDREAPVAQRFIVTPGRNKTYRVDQESESIGAYRTKIDTAFERYTAGVKQVSKTLSEVLTTREQQHRKNGDLKLADKCANERIQLESNERYPTTIPMRGSLAEILRLRGSLDRAYESAIDDLQGAKDKSLLSRIELEWQDSKRDFDQKFGKKKLLLFNEAPEMYLSESKWEFGEGNAVFAYLTLMPDRTISGNKNVNESLWRWQINELMFTTPGGQVTTIFSNIVVVDGLLKLSGPFQEPGRIFYIREMLE